MTRTTLALVVGCALLGWFGAAAAVPAPAEPGIERCFKEDSISCVQKHVFRGIKAFFEQEKIELLGGVSLTRAAGAGAGAGAGEARASAAEDAVLEASVMGAEGDVEAREAALEAFAARHARAFLQERSLRLDLSPVVESLAERARALVAYIPPEVRQRVVEFAAAEARGKKKKLRQLIPLLLLGGLKAAGLAALVYLGVGLLAKKAILVSLVSIAISGFIALKKLASQHGGSGHHHEVHEAYPSHGYSSGYSGGGGYGGGGYGGGGYGGGTFDVSGYSSGGHAEYGSHSSPVGHAVAYSAHKPGVR